MSCPIRFEGTLGKTAIDDKGERRDDAANPRFARVALVEFIRFEAAFVPGTGIQNLAYAFAWCRAVRTNDGPRRSPHSKSASRKGEQGLHALSVDHACARAGLALLKVARRHDQMMIDGFQQPGGPPRARIALHLAAPWKVKGHIAHWQPVEAISRIASTTSHKSVVRGRPVVLRGGMKGATNAHSGSAISLAWSPPQHS